MMRSHGDASEAQGYCGIYYWHAPADAPLARELLWGVMPIARSFRMVSLLAS